MKKAACPLLSPQAGLMSGLAESDTGKVEKGLYKMLYTDRCQMGPALRSIRLARS